MKAAVTQAQLERQENFFKLTPGNYILHCFTRYTIDDRNLGRLLNRITTRFNTELQLWKVSLSFYVTFSLPLYKQGCDFLIVANRYYLLTISGWHLVFRVIVHFYGFLDGAFLQPNSKCWCWWDAQEAGTWDSEEQYRMD